MGYATPILIGCWPILEDKILPARNFVPGKKSGQASETVSADQVMVNRHRGLVSIGQWG